MNADRDSIGAPWVECVRVAARQDDPCGWVGALPADVRNAARSLLHAILGSIPPGLEPLAELVDARTGGRFRAEVEAAAAAFGFDWRPLMLANISYELAVTRLGCSTVLLATEGGPVLARNMDWWPEDLLARSSVVVEYREGAQSQCVNAAWPGAVGAVTGMSHRGFAVALNAVSSPDPAHLEGQPVLLHLRRVLDGARDFDDAIQGLSETPLVCSAMFAVVGTDNDQRAVVERTPTRCAIRRAEGDAPLVVTNDYRALDVGSVGAAVGTQLVATTCGRFDALTAMAAGIGTRPSDTDLLRVLQDPGVMLGITAQHVIARPAEGRFGLYVPGRLLAR